MPIYVADDLRSIVLPDYPPAGLPPHITVTFADGSGTARCALLTEDVWREIESQVDELEAKWERGEWGREDDGAKYRAMVERVGKIRRQYRA